MVRAASPVICPGHVALRRHRYRGGCSRQPPFSLPTCDVAATHPPFLSPCLPPPFRPDGDSAPLWAKHPQKKGAKKSADRRPKKSRPSDINRKKPVYPTWVDPPEYTLGPVVSGTKPDKQDMGVDEASVYDAQIKEEVNF